MPKWWHVSGRRLGKAFLIVFLTPLLLGILVILINGQLAPWRTARSLPTIDPEINLVPAALPDTSVAVLSGERIERFGFSLQLPWKEIDYDNTSKDLAILLSKNHGLMMIENPFSSSGSAGSMRLFANSVPALRQESLHSNYALASTAMAEKTEQVKWWKTPGQNTKDFILLVMKSTIQGEGECRGGLYVVNFGEVRGFQQGRPSVAPYCVKLDLFDSAGLHYEITIEPHKGRHAMTQAEINAIVASLHAIRINPLTSEHPKASGSPLAFASSQVLPTRAKSMLAKSRPGAGIAYFATAPWLATALIICSTRAGSPR